jgi:salicylate hydroxylase
MYPTTGQGGSQSLEDVCALGIILSSLPSKSELEPRLKIMENLRKERASLIQALSGVVFGTEEEFAKARPWHRINQSGIKNAEQHMEFLFG